MSQPEVLAAARSAEGLPASVEMPSAALDPSAEVRLGALGGGEWVKHTTMAVPILPPGEGTGPALGVEQTPDLVVPMITPAVAIVPGRT